MEWLPIESAPKDGTPVLVYQDCEQIVAYWLIAPPDGCGGWHEASCDACGLWPTHWMSLPTPPKA